MAASSYAEAPCPSPNIEGAPQLELGTDFECGYLTVPENRTVADGRTIRIAVARVRATNPDPKDDPIVYLAGGPGGTGIATAVLRVEDGWNIDRDVIFVDQRGTLHSDPLLSCPEIDAFQQSSITLSTSDPAAAAADIGAASACFARLTADGWDLSAYNTTENAADIADLRVALGVDEWNLYGVSYGSDLALQVLRDHPAGIRSLVLDSVVPPQANLVDSFWPNAAVGYAALWNACIADTACAAAYPDLRNEFVSLIGSLAAQPRTVQTTDPVTGQPVAVVIDGYTLANLVIVQSLAVGSLAAVPALIHNLAVGDGSAAATALLAGRPPTGLTGYGLALGVFCGEQAGFTNREQALAAARSALPEFPDSVLSLTPQISRVFDDCAAWKVGPAVPTVHDPVAATVPTLLLSGSLDAITPPVWATVAAGGLTNATEVVFPGAAHDVMIWSAPCAIEVMNSFLDDSSDVDTSCVSALTVPAFSTG